MISLYSNEALPKKNENQPFLLFEFYLFRFTASDGVTVQPQFTINAFAELARTIHEKRGGDGGSLKTVHERRLCFKNIGAKCATAPK